MVGIRGAEDITLDYNFFKGLIRRICTMVVNNYRLMESGSGSSRYAKRVVEYMLTRHCAGGSRQHIIYDCHGNVIPCSFMPESMGLSSGTGGEPSERFDHVYSAVNHLFQSGLADRLKGKCGDCEYKSSCLGGCITMKIPSALSVEDAFDMLSQNVVLEDWVSTYNMIFADGYFVVADKKYVTIKDGKPHLTKRAKTNLAACTLNICEQHIISYKIAKKDYQGYAYLFHAAGVDQRMLSFHPTYQAEFREFLENVEWNEKMGRRPSELSKVTDDDVYAAVAESIFPDYDECQKRFIQMLSDPFTTICQALWYWFENHGLRYPDSFHEATNLHKNYHTDIKNNAKNDMGKDMLMAICVGCRFDLRMTQRVLKKQNIILDEFQEPDRTYITLLERLPGLDINQFNEILKKRNLKELGSKSNSKGKKASKHP